MNWNKIWKIVKNKYVAATLIFVVVFVFLDQNNLFVINRLHHQVHRLRVERDAEQRAIAADSIHALNLVTNLDTIEAVGREDYLMKRDNEDVYIFSE